MSISNSQYFLVYADGQAAESKKLLLARSSLTPDLAFKQIVWPVAGDATELNCPLSESGTLNTFESYTDPQDASRRYFLPTYELAQEEASAPPYQRYAVSLEFTSNPGESAIAQLRAKLKGVDCTSSMIDSHQPLPHDVTVSLQYTIAEQASEGVGVSTWKEMRFDEVKQTAQGEVEAILHLNNLSELNTVYQVMSDKDHHCQLIVHCSADLAYRTLRQIYVKRPWSYIISPEIEANLAKLEVEILPSPKPSISDIFAKSFVGFDYLSLLREIQQRPRIGFPIVEVAEMAPPGWLVPRLRMVKMVEPKWGTHTDYRSLLLELKDHVEAPQIGTRFRLPEYFFRDREERPAYIRNRKSCEQTIPFYFPLDSFGYIYPNYSPSGEIALVRYQVASDQTIYQDTMQPSIFYYLPDEFCLTRKDAPPYEPALQVVFYTLSEQKDTATGPDGESSFNVGFTFKAIPYLKAGRDETALNYIRQNQLVPNDVTPSLAPLLPESVRFFLNLPKEGGGLLTEERTEADIVFTQHIVDSLTLSAQAFSEIFNSMRVGGEPFNGTVRAKLPGRDEEYPIAFNGRLDHLRGTITEQLLVGKSSTDPTAYIVQITNAIESPILLAEVVVYLLVDPSTQRWVTATVAAGALPLHLLPGEQRSITVQPTEPVANAWSVRLDLLTAHIELDFESLWRSVLETLGWGSLTHDVTCTIDANYFVGDNLLEKVIVHFNHGEAFCELTATSLSATVTLTKPVLAYLLRQEEANDYFYRIESWRGGNAITSSAWQEDDSPGLQIVPPMG